MGTKIGPVWWIIFIFFSVGFFGMEKPDFPGRLFKKLKTWRFLQLDGTFGIACL